MSFKYNVLFESVVIAIFSFCGIVGGAIAEPTLRMSIIAAAEPIYTTDQAFREDQASSFTLCPSGQYVSKCGNYRVGFNWLKKATFPQPNASGDNHGSTSTNNYYVSEQADLFEQMRIFFSGVNESILAKDETETISNIAPEDYIADRELILNYLCNPVNSTVTCTACPNGGNVDKSSVKLFGDDNQIVSGSWKFHTFADCHMQDFEDSTGSFSYYYADTGTDAEKAKCYYTNTDSINTLSGDAIGDFIPGLYDSNISLYMSEQQTH